MAAVTICSDFGAPKNNLPLFPSICYEVIGPDAMILVFWILSFKPAVSLSSFTLIKRLFSSSLSATRWYHVYIWDDIIDISSNNLDSSLCFIQPSFHTLYSAYKLNKQDDDIQPWSTPFPIWNQSVVPCPVLTVVSWASDRFLKRQVRCSGALLFTVCCDPHSQRLWHSP